MNGLRTELFCFVFLWPRDSRIEAVVSGFGTHLHVDLQQRGVEYSQLFTKHVALRPAVMERIPPMEHR